MNYLNVFNFYICTVPSCNWGYLGPAGKAGGTYYVKVDKTWVLGPIISADECCLDLNDEQIVQVVAKVVGQ